MGSWYDHLALNWKLKILSVPIEWPHCHARGRLAAHSVLMAPTFITAPTNPSPPPPPPLSKSIFPPHASSHYWSGDMDVRENHEWWLTQLYSGTQFTPKWIIYNRATTPIRGLLPDACHTHFKSVSASLCPREVQGLFKISLKTQSHKNKIN